MTGEFRGFVPVIEHRTNQEVSEKDRIAKIRAIESKYQIDIHEAMEKRLLELEASEGTIEFEVERANGTISKERVAWDGRDYKVDVSSEGYQ